MIEIAISIIDRDLGPTLIPSSGLPSGSMPSMRALALLLLLAACDGCGSSSPEPETPSNPTTPSAGSYALHEWGVITAGRATVSVGTAPPQAPVLEVEKPVLYVHAGAPLELDVRVLPASGFRVAERYPATEGDALRWTASVTGAPCASRHAYPTSCDAMEGRALEGEQERLVEGIPHGCETVELPRYEAADASCLEVGDDSLPLLFYRLEATEAALPVEFRMHEGAAQLRAREGEVAGWRVTETSEGPRAHALRLTTEWTTLGTADGAAMQPVATAAAGLDAAMREVGLGSGEQAVFRQAWWTPFFGEGNAPVAVAEEVEIPEMEEEAFPEGRPAISDVFLYVMPQPTLDSVARLELTPAPSSLHRFFVVRQVL